MSPPLGKPAHVTSSIACVASIDPNGLELGLSKACSPVIAVFEMFKAYLLEADGLLTDANERP